MKHTLKPNHTVRRALLLASALLAQHAWAHGPQGHASQMPMAQHHAAVKEQKPWGIAGERSEARRTMKSA